MIVRIHADNQYRLDDQLGTQLDQLDDELVAALEANDDARFNAALAQVVAFVREHGTLVPMEEVVPSDVIVPASDMTMDEARDLLAKEVQLSHKAPAAGSGGMIAGSDEQG